MIIYNVAVSSERGKRQHTNNKKKNRGPFHIAFELVILKVGFPELKIDLRPTEVYTQKYELHACIILKKYFYFVKFKII